MKDDAGGPSTTDVSGASSHADVDASRLFLGSCVALVATSVAFATVSAVMLALKRDFVLTNEDVGWIGGAALFGFAFSQVVFAPLADTLGMRALLRLAFVGHLLGALVMVFAAPLGAVFGGAFLTLLDRKSTRLNSSHSQQSRMPSSA